ncbi:ATPase MipZ [Photorhabdus australis subsp. thailandensis]|uniref:ATPase MipZ n=1 Tax=Photorhabdus australis subsp. thailandensis TaxID=2805096 RepID=A0A1C0U8A7_9GAMM|nr:AAA family ATPase [Photorhabdus australis]OCQ54106.1 ATPase MipZ [Photorhabdus australis subsp. thailandensis]
MSGSKVILVGGSKGGPGKSTIAQQIAAYLLLKGYTVHLLDIDEQATSYSWCEERVTVNDLKHLAFGRASENIFERINQLKHTFEYIVVDAGGFDSAAQREAMLIATHILYPLRPKRRDMRSLTNLDNVVEQIRELNEGVKVAALMNQCPTLPSQVQRIINAKLVCESFGIDPLKSIVHTRNIYDDAEEDGCSIFEIKGGRDKKAEKEIENVVEEFIFGREITE